MEKFHYLSHTMKNKNLINEWNIVRLTDATTSFFLTTLSRTNDLIVSFRNGYSLHCNLYLIRTFPCVINYVMCHKYQSDRFFEFSNDNSHTTIEFSKWLSNLLSFLCLKTISLDDLNARILIQAKQVVDISIEEIYNFMTIVLDKIESLHTNQKLSLLESYILNVSPETYFLK
jgi:hypothetical protein